MSDSKSKRRLMWIVPAVLVLIGGVAAEIIWTKPVREALATYTGLIQAANRGNLTLAESLCTKRYLATGRLKLAKEGGLIGLPRTIHMNFQAWKENDEVRICPTKGVGPVYRMIREGGIWKFDGLIGQLMPGGKVEPMEEPDEAE